MDSHYYYLLVNLACLAGPFALSFEKKISFFLRWRAIAAGTACMMILFIPWDMLFTHHGVWGFNDEYILGYHIGNLPIEEWLFFICIPYACIFTFECVRYFKPSPPSKAFTRITATAIILISLLLAVLYHDNVYTLTACTLCGALLFIQTFFMKSTWIGHALMAWFILLIPFYVSNGVLTGLDFYQYPIWNSDPDLISDQIVWYNNDHNLGVRIWSVPADDFFYGLFMFLLALSGYNRALRHTGFTAQMPSLTTTGK